MLLALLSAAAAVTSPAPSAGLVTPTGIAGLVAPTAASCYRRIEYPDGLSVLVSDKSTQLRDMIGVRSVLPAAHLEQILAHVRSPDTAWTTDRHSSYPTTDIETATVPWLDELLQPHLRDSLLPMIATLFQVGESQLILRDTCARP